MCSFNRSLLRSVAWALMLFSSTSLAALDAKYFDQIDHIAFQGNANGRGSVNFYGKKNVKAVIPKDSKAKIVKGSATKLPSGAWALKVRVEELGSTTHLGARAANTTSEYWVRYKEGSSYMTLVDNKNRVTAQADTATRARVNRDTPAARIGLSETTRTASAPSYVTQPSTRSKPKAATASSKAADGDPILRNLTQGRYCTTCTINQAFRPLSVFEELEQTIQSALPETVMENMISSYTNSADVREMNDALSKGLTIRENNMCSKAVTMTLDRFDLAERDEVRRRLAYKLEVSLEENGWVNMMDNEAYMKKYGDDPTKAPDGTVLVYQAVGPDAGKPGHAEIKITNTRTGKVEFTSWFRSQQPISTTMRGRRKLIGIMIKPNIAQPTAQSLARR